MTEMIDESPKAVLKGGVIALQMHAGFTMDIQFKDISIKFLDGNLWLETAFPIPKRRVLAFSQFGIF